MYDNVSKPYTNYEKQIRFISKKKNDIKCNEFWKNFVNIVNKNTEAYLKNSRPNY